MLRVISKRKFSLCRNDSSKSQIFFLTVNGFGSAEIRSASDNSDTGGVKSLAPT